MSSSGWYVTVVAGVDVNSFSPWGTVKLFGIFAVFSSCWKSLSFALKSSLFLLFLLSGDFGGGGGGGGIFLGIFSFKFISARCCQAFMG